MRRVRQLNSRQIVTFFPHKFGPHLPNVVHVLDTRQLGRPGIVAVTALETNSGIVLFDTGPESTFATVTDQLHQLGVAPNDVRFVFLSHIHFDHAGAAWRFAELGATIYVHPRGAPHLIDPTRLIESATRIYGDQMEKLWGRFGSISAEKVKILTDNDIVQVPQFEVRAIPTPGHASHHNVYQWEDNLFGGDVAGVRLGGGPPVPPFVPPELHIESWLESLDKIRALKLERLYLPHFGLVTGSISDHLTKLEQRIRRWAVWFRDRIPAGEEEAQLVPAFAAFVTDELAKEGATESESVDYECADPSFMAVSAALRYWRKYHPEDVTRIGSDQSA
jgi:glyoxylase-like metal-dependent hydrolase (beta-lactamase superfamily II)